jgi:chromosome segregation ATPase
MPYGVGDKEKERLYREHREQQRLQRERDELRREQDRRIRVKQSELDHIKRELDNLEHEKRHVEYLVRDLKAKIDRTESASHRKSSLHESPAEERERHQEETVVRQARMHLDMKERECTDMEHRIAEVRRKVHAIEADIEQMERTR